MIIVGVDPGIANCGISAVEKLKEPKDGKQYQVLEAKRVGKGPRRPEGERLDCIADAFCRVLDNHKVVAVGIEKIFFSRNKSSALKIAEVIGIIKYLCYINGKTFYEFTPNDVKAAFGVTSKDKDELADAVTKETGRIFDGDTDHESDATAVAIAFFKYLKEK